MAPLYKVLYIFTTVCSLYTLSYALALMSSYLERVLLRLVQENLPASCISPEVPTNLPSLKKLCSHTSVIDDSDLDADDPRYSFFLSYFIFFS